MQADSNNCVGTLTDLFSNYVIIERAFIRENHGVVIWIIFIWGLTCIGILLLEWGLCLVLLWILFILGTREGHVLFALVILRGLLLHLRDRWILDLLSDTCHRLGVIEIKTFDLLRSRMSDHMSLSRSLIFLSSSSLILRF